MDDAARTEQDRLLDIMRNDLYVAVVSDVLDSIGLLNQAMDDRLRPLSPQMRLVGRAHTVMTAGPNGEASASARCTRRVCEARR